MTDITINLEDLETLIFAAAAVKPIEIALDTRKRDPFVPKEAPIAAAIDRLAREARYARRSKETYQTPWDGPLDGDEILWLRRLCENHDPGVRELRMICVEASALLGTSENPPTVLRQGPIHALANKGMLAIGTAAFAVIWPGAEQPEFWPNPTCFYLMPTSRGLRKWQELKGVPASDAPLKSP